MIKSIYTKLEHKQFEIEFKAYLIFSQYSYIHTKKKSHVILIFDFRSF